MAMKYWLFKNKTEAILSKSSKTSFPSETQTNYLLHDPPDGGDPQQSRQTHRLREELPPPQREALGPKQPELPGAQEGAMRTGRTSFHF